MECGIGGGGGCKWAVFISWPRCFGKDSVSCTPCTAQVQAKLCWVSCRIHTQLKHINTYSKHGSQARRNLAYLKCVQLLWSAHARWHNIIHTNKLIHRTEEALDIQSELNTHYFFFYNAWEIDRYTQEDMVTWNYMLETFLWRDSPVNLLIYYYPLQKLSDTTCK